MAPSAARRPRRHLASAGLILLSYLALAVAMTYPVAREFTRAIPGDGFDGWQNYWNLWWVRRALLVEHRGPYFTDMLYYPTGVSLLFHTLNPFNGLASLPMQLAWGLFPAYNSVALFSFAMGGLGAYLLARRVLGGGSRLAAVAAGIVFAFSPFHFAHLLGHMQVISLEWIPFYALYLLRIVQGAPRFRDAAMAALFLILVGLCDLYYVLYCLLLTLVVLASRLWRAWRAGRSAGVGLPHAVLNLAAAWLLFGLALSPLLVPMVAEARQADYMVPDPTQSRALSADLAAFVTPQEFHPVWGAWASARGAAFTSSPSEHQVFLGFTPLALAVLGAWAGWRRGRSGLWLAVAATFVVLALGPVLHIGGRTALLPDGREIPLPYGWLVRIVPFMEITRSVSRFTVIVTLALGVLTALGLQWLWRRGAGTRVAAALALLLILFEFLPAPYPVSPPDTPAWYGRLADDPRPGAVLNLPMNWDRPGYLLHQTVHGKPLTVAYISRDDPRTLTERAPVLQHLRHLGPDIIVFDLARQGRQVLWELGVRWVVADRYQMPAGEERAYTDRAVREIFGAQAPIYEDERITVHEVTEPEAVAPFVILGEGWGPLDAQHGSRSFTGRATVIIQAPAAADVTLRIEPAPESAPLSPGQGGDAYRLHVPLQAGPNEVELRAAEPDALVSIRSIALEGNP